MIEYIQGRREYAYTARAPVPLIVPGEVARAVDPVVVPHFHVNLLILLVRQIATYCKLQHLLPVHQPYTCSAQHVLHQL